MVFDNLVASIRNRTGRGRAGQSQRCVSAPLPREEREETPMPRTAPPAPKTPAAQTSSVDQMTNQQMLETAMRSFSAMKKSESRQALILPQVPHLKPMTFSTLSHIIPKEKNDDPYGVKKPIVRKPIPSDSPYWKSKCGNQARTALKTRYSSKIEMDLEMLEKRVDEDLAWVAAMWEKAGRGKPSDGDVIEFYDLWSYIEDESIRVRPKSSML